MRCSFCLQLQLVVLFFCCTGWFLVSSVVSELGGTQLMQGSWGVLVALVSSGM